jgi:hypothetical protein
MTLLERSQFMKIKTLLLVAILTLGFSSFSFGASGWLARGGDGSVTFAGTAPIPSLTIKPSANVFFSWDVLANGTTYSIGTIHTSGTFTYCTSSIDTNIYRMPNASNANGTTSQTAYTGTAALCPNAPVNTTTPPDWTGWTASK